jgi:type II secretory pathway component PulF
MAILLDSGMGLVKTVERAAAVSANPFIRADLLRVVPAIQEGSTLEEAFKRMRWLEPRALNMVRACEQTGNLDTTLDSLAKWYYDEAYHTLKSVALVLETIAIIILVLMIL